MRIALGFSACVGLVCCFFPLFDVHGVESALVLGLVLPFPAAFVGCRLVQYARTQERSAPRALAWVALSCAILWAAPVLVLALNQLRTRQCEPWEGLAFEAIGPGVGVQLAGLAGALVGRFVTGRLAWGSAAIALLVPLVAILLGVHAFWSGPSIAVYSQFVGWFPGTLYDVGRTFPMELFTFRTLSAAWWLCGAMVLVATWEGRPHPAASVLAAAALVTAIVGWTQGPSLGHRSTVPAIDEALGGLTESARCILHYPREMQQGAVSRLMADCDYGVHRAERGLDVQQVEPVHAFFYRTPEEKQYFMGAGRTFIAKPWRIEVHLQLAEWPHPVLGHEIVHVVARNAARGPFDVSGTLGGWLPNPGLIEGVAVGIDWPDLEGMDPHQWSRAMRDMDLLPDVESLMGLGFLGTEPRRSYTAAGSFTRFFRETEGVAALRRAHRAGSVPNQAALARAWHAHLDSVELPEGALELAQLRFSRSSIFETACPHRLAGLRGQLGADLAAGDDVRARRTCRQMLAIDPDALDARVNLIGSEARLGRTAVAREALDALEGAPQAAVTQARELIADARWLHGDRTGAETIYAALVGLPQAEASRRLLQVKLGALESSYGESRLVREMFLQRGGGPSDPVSITHLAHALDAVRADGLGRYLLSRQLVNVGRFDLAVDELGQAIARGLPTPSIEREARLLYGKALVANEQFDEARRIFEQTQTDPMAANTSAEWLERVAFLSQR